MPLNKNDLIYKLEYISTFNNNLWNEILKTSQGIIYWGGQNDVTLKDVIPQVSRNADGVPVQTGEQNIKLTAIPKFTNYIAMTGDQTTTGSRLTRRKYTEAGTSANTWERQPFEAVPSVHLRTTDFKSNPSPITSNTRLGFTLTSEDLDAKAEELGVNKDHIVADVIYYCCLEIVNKLVYIRPFTSQWFHKFNERVYKKKKGRYVVGDTQTHIETYRTGNSSISYALFKDNPQINSARESGYSTYDRWASTMGGSITKLTITEASVTRIGLHEADPCDANKTSNVILNYWKAWSVKCQGRNKFDYKYYSCHLNCHSSCHNSCHGARSRR